MSTIRFFCDGEENTVSSFMGDRDVIESCGLFASFYSDRGSHYWYTRQASGKVETHHNPLITQKVKADNLNLFVANKGCR